MSEQTIATVKQIYDRMAKADIAAVLSEFSPSVEIFTPDSLPWSAGHYVGLDGAAEYFKSALGHLEDTRFDVEDLLPSGDWVVALGHWSGRAVPTGGEFRVRFVHFWTFRDGLVIRAEGVSDTAGIIRAFEPNLASH